MQLSVVSSRPNLEPYDDLSEKNEAVFPMERKDGAQCTCTPDNPSSTFPPKCFMARDASAPERSKVKLRCDDLIIVMSNVASSDS